MANLTFPSNPTNGQKFTSNGKVFAYDSTTQRWSVTRVQLLGSLPDDVTIETPDLTLDNTAISFSASGTTVYVHYTVSDDVSVSIANNGLANSSYATATLSRSNNTITITSGTLDFSGANVVVTVTNNRTSNTASISLSQALPDMFDDPTNLVQISTSFGNWWDITNGDYNGSQALQWGGDDLPYMITMGGQIWDPTVSVDTAINASNTIYAGPKCWVQPEGTANTYVAVNRAVSGIDGFFMHNVTNLQQPFVVTQVTTAGSRPDVQQNLATPSTTSDAIRSQACVFYKNYLFSLGRRGMQVFKVSAGGKITFHGSNYEIVNNTSQFDDGNWGAFILAPPDNSNYIIYGHGYDTLKTGIVPFNDSTGELGSPTQLSTNSLASTQFGTIDGTFATVDGTHYYYTRTWNYNSWRVFIHTYSNGTFTYQSTLNVEVDGASSNDNYAGMYAQGNYLFVIGQTTTTDDFNFLVYDLSSDPTAPTLVETVAITDPSPGFTDTSVPIGITYGGKHAFLISNDLPTIAFKDAS